MMEVDKSKLMKLITQRFSINKSNCDILENITLKFGEHKITITQELSKKIILGVNKNVLC